MSTSHHAGPALVIFSNGTIVSFFGRPAVIADHTIANNRVWYEVVEDSGKSTLVPHFAIKRDHAANAQYA